MKFHLSMILLVGLIGLCAGSAVTLFEVEIDFGKLWKNIGLSWKGKRLDQVIFGNTDEQLSANTSENSEVAEPPSDEIVGDDFDAEDENPEEEKPVDLDLDSSQSDSSTATVPVNIDNLLDYLKSLYHSKSTVFLVIFGLGCSISLIMNVILCFIACKGGRKARKYDLPQTVTEVV